MSMIALMAIPGAGKSTWIEQQGPPAGVTVVSPDEIRLALTGDMSNQDRNAEVFAEARRQAAEALAAGDDVVWDATNVTARARADILSIAKAARAHAELVVLDVPLAVAKERNAGRERVVPEDVLDRMFGQFHDSLGQIGTEGWDVIQFDRQK